MVRSQVALRTAMAIAAAACIAVLGEFSAAAKNAPPAQGQPPDKVGTASAPAPVAPTQATASQPVKMPPSFPKTLPEAKAEAEALNKPPEKWQPEVIAAAKARCDAILKKINAVAIPEEPIKQGACGTPAPIQLISIGKKPQVSISPPAIITCELAEALSSWVENDLQPLAKARLGAEIIKIETMSSYSCRNAYGRAKSKLSEHGVANALDIRGFVTASAKTAYVLEDWGKPQREIIAEIAAAKAAAEKAASERAAAEKAAQSNQVATKGGAIPSPAKASPPSATASTIGAPAAGIARNTFADGIPKLTVTLPGAKAEPKPSIGFAEPDRLGGPKISVVIAVPAPSQQARKTEFLHQAHAAACRIFGTTLGPEANSDHRNHFHVDMAERKIIKICD